MYHFLNWDTFQQNIIFSELKYFFTNIIWRGNVVGGKCHRIVWILFCRLDINHSWTLDMCLLCENDKPRCLFKYNIYTTIYIWSKAFFEIVLFIIWIVFNSYIMRISKLSKQLYAYKIYPTNALELFLDM